VNAPLDAAVARPDSGEMEPIRRVRIKTSDRLSDFSKDTVQFLIALPGLLFLAFLFILAIVAFGGLTNGMGAGH
jgi:hypothetical protein